MSKNSKKKKSSNKKIAFLIFLLMLILSSVLMIKINTMDILNLKNFIIISVILVLASFLLFIAMLKVKKPALRITTIILSLILVSGLGYAIYNVDSTISFVEDIVAVSIKKEVYNVYVLNDSPLKEMSDLKDTKMAIYSNGGDNVIDAVALLKKEINGTFKTEKYLNELEEILKSGVDKKYDALFIADSLDQLIEEEYEEMRSQFRVLGTITLSKKENVKKSNVDVSKDSFIVYLSGIDTYGSIGTVSRSDVNILLVVNPKTNKILLVNTPRDYYVMLHSKKAYDKLTHAGIYGVEESLTTLEDLYDINIDFYYKVNFSSLIKIVDSLGGITVNSKYSFSYDGYSFRKGENKLNGHAALAFSRFRKGLPEGDKSRGENQEAVIVGTINKIATPSIISKYSTILNTLSKSFVTNMDKEDIYKLAKYQLNENPTWEFSTENADGEGDYASTFSAGKTKLYVMRPDDNSVSSVKSSIKSIMD